MLDPIRTSGNEAGNLPANVELADGCAIIGEGTFRRFFSRQNRALCLGRYSRAEHVNFAVGEQGRIIIGQYCYLCDCTLLAEKGITIGDYVMIGWGTTISDSDFHPIGPAERILDAIALSPSNSDIRRPKIQSVPVTIGSGVYIGPACTILKGVNVGDRAFIEPGSVVTRDVEEDAHVAGNPASIVI